MTVKWTSSLNPRRAIAITVSVVALGGAFTPPRSHAIKQTGGEYNTLYANLGAKGYDVVSYFTDGKPVKGSERYTHNYGGVTWHFSSQEHRDAFAADPAKYAPQYGGFCSWGVSQGKLFDVDPEHGWAIVDGKLYLNFNGDIHRTWLKDTRGFISKADQNFPTLNK